MLHGKPELRLQALRDERAVAGLGIGLDAHEHSCPVDRHRLDDRPEGDPVENLPEVPRPVLGGELNPRALADPAPAVLSVLELSKLGGRRQLLAMPILDSSLSQRRLEACRVRPGIPTAPNAAPLANIEHLARSRFPQGTEPRLERPVVHPDGGRATRRAYTAETASATNAASVDGSSAISRATRCAAARNEP